MRSSSLSDKGLVPRLALSATCVCSVSVMASFSRCGWWTPSRDRTQQLNPAECKVAARPSFQAGAGFVSCLSALADAYPSAEAGFGEKGNHHDAHRDPDSGQEACVPGRNDDSFGLSRSQCDGGGLALLLDLDGTRPPISWLDEVPVVDSYLIPGLVLGVGFGVVSIVTTYGMIRRPRWKVGRRARTRQPPSLVVDRDHPPRRRTSCLDWP